MNVESLLPPRGSNYTTEELKTAFRAACHEVHPDKGGTSQDFIQLRALFKAMLPAANDMQQQQEAKTSDGRSLSELGRGLGPTTNGKDCGECNSKGYRTHMLGKTKSCLPCHGTGYANGRFPHRMTTLSNIRVPLCRQCHGAGWIQILNEEVIHETCYKCKGAGEVEIWNPVLQKGRI